MGWITTYERNPETGRLEAVTVGTQLTPGSDRRYRAQWREPSGKTKTKMFRLTHDAARHLRDVESSKDRGTYFDPARGKVLFADWCEHVIDTATQLRPSTLALYRQQTRTHLIPALGDRPLGSIDTSTVRRVVADWSRTLGAGATSGAFRLLRRVLEQAVADGIIAANPARGVHTPKAVVADKRFLTADELAAVADHISPRYRALVLLLGWRGLRFGEAAALRTSDIDTLSGRVLITKAVSEVGGELIEGPTKTGRSRSVRCPSALRDELIAHLQAYGDPTDPDALVFTTGRGTQLQPNSFRQGNFHGACRRAGVTPRPRVHDLRHTAVALAIASGAHPKEVQEMCGHSSIAITFDVYGHLFETLQEATVDRLDEMLRAARAPVSAPVVTLPRATDG